MCGITGVIGVENACHVIVKAQTPLQGRGLEAASIGAIVNDKPVIVRVEGSIDNLKPMISAMTINACAAVGHNRYGTSGGSNLENAHPFDPNPEMKPSLLLVHNGEILGADKHRAALEKEGIDFQGTSDTEVLLRIMENKTDGDSVIDRVIACLKNFHAAYSLVILWDGYLIGACDPYGFHPLSLGKFENGGYIFASEDPSFHVVGARKDKSLKPGQVIVISPSLDKTEFSLNGKPVRTTGHCSFNFVYTANPDGKLWNRSVSTVREKLGSKTYYEHAAAGIPEIDVIVPVLDSGRDATRAYAFEYYKENMARLVEDGLTGDAIRRMDINSFCNFSFGINRSRNARRSFILPDQTARDDEITLKHLGDTAIIKGKRVIIGDDSSVRGSTARKLSKMVRGFGATEIHFVIFSPEVVFSCPFGGNETKDPNSLIAVKIPDIQLRCEEIEADSLFHISLPGFAEVLNFNDNHCMFCFGGESPVLLSQS